MRDEARQQATALQEAAQKKVATLIAQAESRAIALRADAEQQLRQTRGQLNEFSTRLRDTRDQVVQTEELALLQEAGIYEYRHPLADAVAYKAKLAGLKDQIKSSVRNGSAVLASTSWAVNGSEEKGWRYRSKLMVGCWSNLGKPMAPKEYVVDCWPPCSQWCQCVDGHCQPSPVVINAVRLRTRDDRYVRARFDPAAGDDYGPSALEANHDLHPEQATTFLFVTPPTGWPMSSEDLISLMVCNANWEFSGNLIRVDWTQHHNPGQQIVYYVLGGPDTQLYVSADDPNSIPPYPFGGSTPLTVVAGL
jgi:hypothetical protein